MTEIEQGITMISVRQIFLIFISAIWLFSTGCSTSSRLTFQSDPPKAEIYVKPLQQGEFKYMGTTPLVIRSSDIATGFGELGPIYVEYRKAGYNSENVIITEMNHVDLNIDRELKAISGLENVASINWAIDTLFEVEKLVKLNQYEKALVQIEELKKQLPQVAAIYEMEGGIFYLQRKYNLALESYRQASKYNPRNPNNIQMRDMLEERLGARKDNNLEREKAKEQFNNEAE